MNDMSDCNLRKSIWETIFRNEAWGQYPSTALVKFMAKNYYHLVKQQNVRVLEIGPATGGNLWYLSREGFEIYGIEQSLQAYNKLLVKLDSEKVNYQVDNLRSENVLTAMSNFSDSFFDVIIDIECLSCNTWQESKSIIKLCQSKLKKDGSLFSQTFSYKTSGGRTFYSRDLQKIKSGPLSKQKYVRFISKKDVLRLY